MNNILFLLIFLLIIFKSQAQRENLPKPSTIFSTYDLKKDETLLSIFNDLKDKGTEFSTAEPYYPSNQGLTWRDSSIASDFNPDGNLFVVGGPDSIVFVVIKFITMDAPRKVLRSGEVVGEIKQITIWFPFQFILADLKDSAKLVRRFNNEQLRDGVMKLPKGTRLFLKKGARYKE